MSVCVFVCATPPNRQTLAPLSPRSFHPSIHPSLHPGQPNACLLQGIAARAIPVAGERPPNSWVWHWVLRNWAPDSLQSFFHPPFTPVPPADDLSIHASRRTTLAELSFPRLSCLNASPSRSGITIPPTNQRLLPLLFLDSKTSKPNRPSHYTSTP